MFTVVNIIVLGSAEGTAATQTISLPTCKQSLQVDSAVLSTAVAAKSPRKPFNTNLVKIEDFDSRLSGGIKL